MTSSHHRPGVIRERCARASADDGSRPRPTAGASRPAPTSSSARSDGAKLSDAALLELFGHDPDQAWDRFIDKHADLMLATLRRLGMGHDDLMDCFVYICEKLCAQRYRRLRGIQRLGDQGELTPWLRTVMRRLVINWVVAKQGRRRLLRPIARLDRRDRAVFRHYFWRGLSPIEICGTLSTGGVAVRLIDVYASLERILARLSDNKRWRLIANLARARPPLAWSDEVQSAGVAAPDPEATLLRDERTRAVRQSLARLPDRERLLLQLRYDDALPVAEVASVLGISVRAARRALTKALSELRQQLSQEGLSVD